MVALLGVCCAAVAGTRSIPAKVRSSSASGLPVGGLPDLDDWLRAKRVLLWQQPRKVLTCCQIVIFLRHARDNLG